MEILPISIKCSNRGSIAGRVFPSATPNHCLPIPFFTLAAKWMLIIASSGPSAAPFAATAEDPALPPSHCGCHPALAP